MLDSPSITVTVKLDDLSPETLGAWFAGLGSDKQAEFLRSAYQAMGEFERDGKPLGDHGRELQLCALGEEFKRPEFEEAEWMVREMFGFAGFNDDEPDTPPLDFEQHPDDFGELINCRCTVSRTQDSDGECTIEEFREKAEFVAQYPYLASLGENPDERLHQLAAYSKWGNATQWEGCFGRPPYKHSAKLVTEGGSAYYLEPWPWAQSQPAVVSESRSGDGGHAETIRSDGRIIVRCHDGGTLAMTMEAHGDPMATHNQLHIPATGETVDVEPWPWVGNLPRVYCIGRHIPIGKVMSGNGTDWTIQMNDGSTAQAVLVDVKKANVVNNATRKAFQEFAETLNTTAAAIAKTKECGACWTFRSQGLGRECGKCEARSC